MKKHDNAVAAALAAGGVPLDSGTRFDSLSLHQRRKGSPRVRAGFDGWLRWELVDRKGRVVQGGEQHNLLLDAGLDWFGSNLFIPDRNTGPGEDFCTHACVGTGSTPPDASDTTLASELARTDTIIHRDWERPNPGEYVLTRTFSFGFAQGNGNLTEWGIASGAVGNLLVRELIRDPLGNPITLTKTSDYELRLTYVFEIHITPTAPEGHDVIITGLNGGNPINGTIAFLGGGVSSPTGSGGLGSNADVVVFSYVAAGVTGNSAGKWRAGLPFARNAPTTGYESVPNITSSASEGSRTNSAFTPGVWERSVTGTFGTGAANMTIACLGVLGPGQSNTTDRRPGFVFNIDSGDRPTKDNEHILTVNNLLTVTWGRA